MKKVRIILSAVAVVFAIVGASATVTLLDAPVRGVIGGVCQPINCTLVPRSNAACPIFTDDGNFFAPTDIGCNLFPLTTFVRARISQ